MTTPEAPVTMSPSSEPPTSVTSGEIPVIPSLVTVPTTVEKEKKPDNPEEPPMPQEDKENARQILKRFLYTYNRGGPCIVGNTFKYIKVDLFEFLNVYIRKETKDFLDLLKSVNKDPLLIKRVSLFYITAEALKEPTIHEVSKEKIKNIVFELVNKDEEFFDFVQLFTLLDPKRKKNISTQIRKMIKNFYKLKDPEQFTDLVARQESFHGWTHKNLFRLSHYKCVDQTCIPVMNYALFGSSALEEQGNEETRPLIDKLRKFHELKTTLEVSKAVALMKELHATVYQVNSKLNKNEQIWVASLPELSTRKILQHLYSFFKYGFLKNHNGQFFNALKQELTNTEKIKSSNLHPMEVFSFTKFFEKGGKVPDVKLVKYLKGKDVKDETLQRILTPIEPKCKQISQALQECLQISYRNCQPTGKRFFITIDVTEKHDTVCFRQKRVTVYEAAAALARFLIKKEKSVTVAVFKDNSINFVDIKSKSHMAVANIQEHTANYIVPTAPIDFCRRKKKAVDVFINFMNATWRSKIPKEVREKMESLPEAINKYMKRTKISDVRLVKIVLAGPKNAYTGDDPKNVLTIAGFAPEVPRILEAFCRGQFS